MDFTSYNTFPKPDNREAFGDEYRQWADDLDVLARKEGPIADRPASAPTGAIYDATDQQVRYRYDGSAWVVIGGIGSAAKPLPSVNIEELSVGTDGPATGFGDLGLLAEAGFSSGDFFPLKTYYGSAENVSTTSTTYVNFNDTWQPTISLAGLPSGVTPAWVGETRVFPGTDETMDLRFNAGNGDVILVEETDITTYQNLVMGPVETDISGQKSTIFEMRTDPGNNSSRADDPVLIMGVILP
jgi:hypothetical protein